MSGKRGGPSLHAFIMREAASTGRLKVCPKKLTQARRRVLGDLVRLGGKGTSYDLAYPRSQVTHALHMGGLIRVEGRLSWDGSPAFDGFWVITELGRKALEAGRG